MRVEYNTTYGSFVINSKGAALCSFRWKGVEVVPEFDPPSACDEWKTGHLLFPFPARLQGGNRFDFEGEQWIWPLNDPDTNSAIHGLSAYEDFELSLDAKGITAVWKYDGSKPYYPFSCQISVRYELREDGLSQYISVTNSSDSIMPFHIGWHPYVSIVGAWSIEGKLESEISYDRHKTPVVVKAFTGLKVHEEIDKAVCAFSNGRSLSFEDSVKRITLQGMSSWFQVFAPAHASFVALEPLTGVGHPKTPWETLAPKEDRIYTNVLTVALK